MKPWGAIVTSSIELGWGGDWIAYGILEFTCSFITVMLLIYAGIKIVAFLGTFRILIMQFS